MGQISCLDFVQKPEKSSCQLKHEDKLTRLYIYIYIYIYIICVCMYKLWIGVTCYVMFHLSLIYPEWHPILPLSLFLGNTLHLASLSPKMPRSLTSPPSSLYRRHSSTLTLPTPTLVCLHTEFTKPDSFPTAHREEFRLSTFPSQLVLPTLPNLVLTSRKRERIFVLVLKLSRHI